MSWNSSSQVFTIPKFVLLGPTHHITQLLTAAHGQNRVRDVQVVRVKGAKLSRGRDYKATFLLLSEEG